MDTDFEPTWALTEYDAVKRAAQMEHPPGREALYLGALDTLRTGDRSFVDKAALAVRGNIPEGDFHQIYGAALFDCGHTDEGLAALRRARDADPTRNALLILGCRLDKASRLSEAAAVFREVLARNNSDTEAALRLGHVLSEEGRWQEAAEHFQIILDGDRKCGSAHLKMAEAEAKRRNYESARKHALKATKYGCRDLAWAWYYLSVSEAHLLRSRNARRAARRCHKIGANEEHVRRLMREFQGEENLGQEYFEDDRLKEAVPWLKYEVAIKPPSMVSRLYLASIQSVNGGDPGIIATAAEELLRVLPEDLVLQVRGLTKYRLGLHAEGVVDMREAARQNPSHRNKLCLASALEELGQKAEAKTLCEEALAETPDSSDALCYLALMADDLEEALRLHRKACDLDPYAPIPRYQVGYILEQLGRIAEAREEYKAALKLDIPEPESCCTAVAECHLELKEHDEAIRWAKEALWYDSNYEPAQEVLQEATELLGKRQGH